MYSSKNELIKQIKELSNRINDDYHFPLAINNKIETCGDIKAFIKEKMKLINNKIRRLKDDLKKFKESDNNCDLQEIINAQKSEIKDFVNIKELLLEYLTMQENGMNKMKDEIYNIKNRKPKYPNIIKPVLYKGAIKRQQNIFDDRAKRNKQFDFSDDKKIKRQDRRDYSVLRDEKALHLEIPLNEEELERWNSLYEKNKKQYLGERENDEFSVLNLRYNINKGYNINTKLLKTLFEFLDFLDGEKKKNNALIKKYKNIIKSKKNNSEKKTADKQIKQIMCQNNFIDYIYNIYDSMTKEDSTEINIFITQQKKVEVLLQNKLKKLNILKKKTKNKNFIIEYEQDKKKIQEQLKEIKKKFEEQIKECVISLIKKLIKMHNELYNHKKEFEKKYNAKVQICDIKNKISHIISYIENNFEQEYKEIKNNLNVDSLFNYHKKKLTK